VRRTWGQRGKTTLVVTPFNWKRLSAIAGLTTTPTAWRVGLCLRLHPDAIKQPQILDYLQALKRHIRGRKAILLWDRLPAHRGGDVQAYLRQQASWLTMAYLPPYAPELNPVEYFLAHLSGAGLMANFVGENLKQGRHQAQRVACRVRNRPHLGRAFLKHSGLFR